MSVADLLGFLFIAALSYLAWAWHIPLRSWRYMRTAAFCLIAIGLLASIALLLAVLHLASSHDVRDATGYICFYFILGQLWIAIAIYLASWLGIGLRDDALERRNPAAAIALGGAICGFTLCYAGANIGDGPGASVVNFCSLLAVGGLLASWAWIEYVGHVSELVTVERDVAAGLRLGGFLLASGLVLGRAVAGDWHDVSTTVSDFLKIAWPVAIFATLEGGIARFSQRTLAYRRTNILFALVLSLAYVLIATTYVAWLGEW